jgi:hypothetical protein
VTGPALDRRAFLRLAGVSLAGATLPRAVSCPPGPYADLTAARLRDRLAELELISLASRNRGELVWGRVPGSAADLQTAQLVRDALAAAGCADARLEPFALPETQWTPTAAACTLAGGSSPAAPAADVRYGSATSPRRAGSTPPGGLEAPAIDVGYGSEDDLAGLDLTGKVAVMRFRPSGADFFDHSGDANVPNVVGGAHGRPAGLVVVPTAPGAPPDLLVNATGFAPAADLPWLMLSDADGSALLDVVARSGPTPPRVRLLVRGSMQGGTSRNVVGTLPGASSRCVVLVAHLDSFFQGTGDNATGVAVLQELARHFGARAAADRRRTLVFVGTGAHHNGPAGGARAFRTAHGDVLARTDRLINLEHLASTLRDGGHARHHLSVTDGSAAVVELWDQALAEHGAGVERRTTVERAYAADLKPFAGSGVPGTMLIQRFFWYHTNHDTVARVPLDRLEGVARVHAHVIDRL